MVRPWISILSYAPPVRVSADDTVTLDIHGPSMDNHTHTYPTLPVGLTCIGIDVLSIEMTQLQDQIKCFDYGHHTNKVSKTENVPSSCVE